MSKRAREEVDDAVVSPRHVKRACTVTPFTVDDLPDEILDVVGRAAASTEPIFHWMFVNRRFARLFGKSFHLRPVDTAMQGLKEAMQSKWDPQTTFVPLRDTFRATCGGGGAIPKQVQKLYVNERLAGEPNVRLAVMDAPNLGSSLLEGHGFWEWCTQSKPTPAPTGLSLPDNMFVTSIAQTLVCLPDEERWLMVMGRLLHLWFLKEPIDVLCYLQMRLTGEATMPEAVRTFLEHVFVAMILAWYYSHPFYTERNPLFDVTMPILESNHVAGTLGDYHRYIIIDILPLYRATHPILQFYLGCRDKNDAFFRHLERRNLWGERIPLDAYQIETNNRLGRLREEYTLPDLLDCFAVPEAIGHLAKLAHDLLPSINIR